MRTKLTQTPAWQTLLQHQQEIAGTTLQELFIVEPARGQHFHVEAAGLWLDYSKNHFTQATLQHLIQLAEQAELAQHIEDLFIGKPVNFTEQRAALHTALRAPSNSAVLVNDKNIIPEIQANLLSMQQLVQAVTERTWLGFSNKPITDIVNIGIGGSHLGPALVCEALKDYSQSPLRIHFIANLDPDNQRDVLAQLNPEQTLVIVSSKSFNTFETLTNARAVQAWFTQNTSNNAAWQRHFFAVTANPQVAIEFGILPAHIFPIWDWIGGRYSLWSAVGLPIMFQIGAENFFQLLQGAHELDQHFRTAVWTNNLPILMALLGVWYRNFWAMTSHAIIPYCYRLRYLPAYLQQADMESNGKSVNYFGEQVHYQTGSVLWGSEGCNSQHAFHQLLHQGTQAISIDFIAPVKNAYAPEQQTSLLAQLFSQSQALLQGKTLARAQAELTGTKEAIAKLAPHYVILGNRPNNILLFPELTPYYLGALIALYEHKIFVQGVIWQINSFDQFGVELGKQLSKKLLPALMGQDNTIIIDSSTAEIIKHYRQVKS